MRTIFIPLPEVDGEVNYWGCAVRFRDGGATLVADVAVEGCVHPPTLPDGKPHPLASKPMEPGKRHRSGRLTDALTEVKDAEGNVTKRRDGWWLQIGEV